MEIRSECSSRAILLIGEILLRDKESCEGHTGKYTKYLSWKKKKKGQISSGQEYKLGFSAFNRTRKVPFTLLFFKGHSPVKVKRMAPRGRACPFLLCFLSQGTGGCLVHLQVPMVHGTPRPHGLLQVVPLWPEGPPDRAPTSS